MLRRKFDLPFSEDSRRAFRSFSLTEKTIFMFFTALFIFSSVYMLVSVNNNFLVSVPVQGGEVVEGIVGSPRFVNPLLSISDADKDLTALIYSGLLKATTEGALIPDLAESYGVSEDGLTYTFLLKKDIRFHDGRKITTEDVEFTILKAQDPALKSPRRANWDGVAIEKINESEIRFTLKQPYASFAENTTIGILPKHIWGNANADEFAFSEYNILPTGSGPYKVKEVKRNSAGLPSEYVLRANNDYALGTPFIKTFRFKFYNNENSLLNALGRKEIESANSLNPALVKELEARGDRVERTTLPRIFGVFFNQNEAGIFTHKEAREALDRALDKEAIIADVLSGYGSVINSPLPPDKNETKKINLDEDRLALARSILEKGGWKRNEKTGVYELKTKTENSVLRFTISTSDAPELKRAASLVEETWEALGADVDVAIYDTGDLNQSVIRPRKYQALLFGEIVGRDLDLFPFWHSSQRNDPGLNIALYVNNKADKILEEARMISDPSARLAKYREFEAEVKRETPVVFLYSPDFLYLMPKKIDSVRLGQLTIPAERFLNINEWYIETSKVWKIFIKS